MTTPLVRQAGVPFLDGLLILANAIEATTEQYFDMTVWHRPRQRATKDRPACGTASCAMGIACTLPTFKQLGLRRATREHCFVPQFDGDHGFMAAARLFQISLDDATWLFSSDSYLHTFPTPHSVVGRLRQFVHNQRKYANP